MVFADTIQLIAESPSSHGAFDSVTETARQVFCEVKSVGRTEYYLAASAGLSPEYVFELTDYEEYKGEKLLIYKNERYRIIRTYRTGTAIDLTVGREAVE